MKIINSFIVDNGEKQTKIELMQLRIKFPKRYFYVVKQGDFKSVYFTKFFAKRKFNKLKKGYKSCWLQYDVYNDII